jgi:hypothetical protein
MLRDRYPAEAVRFNTAIDKSRQQAEAAVKAYASMTESNYLIVDPFGIEVFEVLAVEHDRLQVAKADFPFYTLTLPVITSESVLRPS